MATDAMTILYGLMAPAEWQVISEGKQLKLFITTWVSCLPTRW
ncbi:MAG: hypothetical protein CM1200mP18_11310 [Gammaproteobacteria bacterium]|nr:MAG: hypothetical protein CM1200mP18_11310 [Gammaproteobacteria bacterium]